MTSGSTARDVYPNPGSTSKGNNEIGAAMIALALDPAVAMCARIPPTARLSSPHQVVRHLDAMTSPRSREACIMRPRRRDIVTVAKHPSDRLRALRLPTPSRSCTPFNEV